MTFNNEMSNKNKIKVLQKVNTFLKQLLNMA